jgi:predicted glycoside hydrolase/deacetylase ChbG (UPF0249 family)
VAATTEPTARVPRLVINADDFGLSEGINRGIMEAFHAGALRSTSIMVGMPAFRSAVRYAQAAGDALGVGLHFTLTAGRPLTPAPSLTDPATGLFFSLPVLVRRALLGRVRALDVAEECAAQIGRARQAGLRLTHLDGHHHVHLLPGAQDVVREVVQAERIPGVRRPRERLFGIPAWRRRFPERLVMRFLSFAMESRLWAGIRMTDHFVGSTLLGAPDFLTALLRVLESLGPGSTELMVHPGYVPEPLPGNDPYTSQREAELSALTSQQVLSKLRSGSIALVRFDEL